MPSTAYSKMNKARDAVRTELSEPEGNASAHGSRKDVLCEREQGLVPFTLWRAKGASYEAGGFRGYGDSGWLPWRWVHRIEKGSCALQGASA